MVRKSTRNSKASHNDSDSTEKAKPEPKTPRRGRKPKKVQTSDSEHSEEEVIPVKRPRGTRQAPARATRTSRRRSVVEEPPSEATDEEKLQPFNEDVSENKEAEPEKEDEAKTADVEDNESNEEASTEKIADEAQESSAELKMVEEPSQSEEKVEEVKASEEVESQVIVQAESRRGEEEKANDEGKCEEGKGKSNNKTKSKSESSTQPIDSKPQNEHDISENVQVTPVSPIRNDNRVDNDGVVSANDEIVHEKNTETPPNSDPPKNYISNESDQKDTVNEVPNKKERTSKTLKLSRRKELQKQTEVVEESKEQVNESVGKACDQSGGDIPNKEKEVIEKTSQVLENEQPADVENKKDVQQPMETVEKSEDVTPEKKGKSSRKADRSKSREKEHRAKTPEKLESATPEKTESTTPEKTESTTPEKTESATPEKKGRQVKISRRRDKTPVEEEATPEKPAGTPDKNESAIKDKSGAEMDTSKNEDDMSDKEDHSESSTEPGELPKEKLKLKRILDEEEKCVEKLAALKAWDLEYLKDMNICKVTFDDFSVIYEKVEFLDEEDVKLEIIERISLQNKARASIDGERPSYDTQVSEKSEDNQQEENIIALNRKISIVDDTASKLRPPPSPAKNPVSTVLYITNLVRPFTIKQLREMLERTGKIQENGLWTDRIKSKCYVQYETEEEAEVTRNAIHGVNWPIGNGKKLVIEYSTAEEMDAAQNPPTPVVPQTPEEVVGNTEKENLEPEAKKRRSISESESNDKRENNHVREWDVGKDHMRRDRSKSRSRSRDRHDKKRHRRSPSPRDDYQSRKQKKYEEAIPQKLMDDLFQKTKTMPSIFWLPLSPEEISQKQQQRLQRMAEHKRRMEETTQRGGRADFNNRGAPYRRRFD